MQCHLLAWFSTKQAFIATQKSKHLCFELRLLLRVSAAKQLQALILDFGAFVLVEVVFGWRIVVRSGCLIAVFGLSGLLEFCGLFFGSFLVRLSMQARGLASLGFCCGSCAGCLATLRWSLLSAQINYVGCVWLEAMGYLFVEGIASRLSKLARGIFGGSLVARHLSLGSKQGLC